MWISLHNLQEIHKINDKLSGSRHDNLFNMFPSKHWISSDLIPAAIILGSPNLYYNILGIIFGAYAQVYIVTNNSTKHITVVVIALRPANERGRC